MRRCPFTPPSVYVERGAAANPGAVSNLISMLRAIRDRNLPGSASVAKQTAARVRSLARGLDETGGLARYLTDLEADLTRASGSQPQRLEVAASAGQRTVPDMRSDGLVSELQALRERARELRAATPNEADTKRLLVEPVLAALGWDLHDLDAVTAEYRLHDGTAVDYALKIGGRPVLLCEAKALGRGLDDLKWATQVVNYANGAGIGWCVLTDGWRWKVYKSDHRAAVDRKLAFVAELGGATAVAAHEAAELLSRLSPAQIADGELDRYGERVFVDERVREALAAVLSEPQRRFVDVVRDAQETDERLDRAQVRSALGRLTGPLLEALHPGENGAADSTTPGRPAGAPHPPRRPAAPSPGGGGNPDVGPLPDLLAGEPATRGQLARIAAEQNPSRRAAHNRVVALIRAGLLREGETLTLTYRGRTHHATLRGDGRLKVPDADEPLALSSAARVVIGAGKWNGWDWWKARRAAGPVALARLRDELAGEVSAGTTGNDSAP